MSNINLSAVVLTKNSASHLAKTLKSLSFADEIIIVDDFSIDKTLEIARKFQAKIFPRALNEDFTAQRNFGLDKASGKWVLFVDSDEVVSADLKAEIAQRVTSPKTAADGFYLKRWDNLWGKTLKHGEVGHVQLLRLAKKGKGLWHRRVHEVWEVLGPTMALKSPLLHFPHQSLGEFIDDINTFSDLDVQAKKAEGKRASLAKIVFWPWAKFIWNFKFRLGFLDGMPGFVVALVMSFHSFLSWSKLWVEQKHSP